MTPKNKRWEGNGLSRFRESEFLEAIVVWSLLALMIFYLDIFVCNSEEAIVNQSCRELIARYLLVFL
jgi:hypothetical protein